MNTQIALSLGVVILGLLFLDGFFNDWNVLIFLMRKLTELTEYLAFWR